MSVLRPQIVIIGNRRYRKNPSCLSYESTDNVLEPYEEETCDMFIENKNIKSNIKKYQTDENDEPCDSTLSCKLVPKQEAYIEDDEDYSGIEAINNGMFKCTLLVHESYFGFIIGRNGEKKMNLEQDTKTKIKIPKRGQGDWLIIEGKDKSSIASCRNRILLLINSARLQKPFTHLLTFPLNFDKFKKKFNEFTTLVLKSCIDDRGVDDSIFQYPNKLHLTICTVILLNEDEIDKAVNLLQECRRTFIKDYLKTRPLRVSIKGLEYMNDDPSEVDVLYAKVRPIADTQEDDFNQNTIQSISDKLMEKFIDAGFTKKQYDRVKLHATVMNSLMRQDPSGTTEGARKQNNKLVDRERESFDARNILKLYSDYDFGTYEFNEIHLSLRYSSGSDGYYECISKINL